MGSPVSINIHGHTLGAGDALEICGGSACIGGDLETNARFEAVWRAFMPTGIISQSSTSPAKPVGTAAPFSLLQCCPTWHVDRCGTQLWENLDALVNPDGQSHVRHRSKIPRNMAPVEPREARIWVWKFEKASSAQNIVALREGVEQLAHEAL